jgi:hypothetical protein
MPNHPMAEDQQAFVDLEIARLLEAGAIEACTTRPFCVSPLGVVPKKSGSFRLIHNLQRLNRSLVIPAFRYEALEEITPHLAKGSFMATWDLSNGFQHINVHAAYQRFLGFQWRRKFYQWKVLPFGLATSPFIFTKVVRQVMKILRAQSMTIFSYVDDFLLIAPSQQQCAEQTAQAMALLDCLGWSVNLAKSSLLPEPEKEFLGFLLSCAAIPKIKFTPKRLHSCRHEVNRLTRHASRELPVRRVSQVVGLCVSMTRAFSLGKTMLRSLYRDIKSAATWETQIKLSSTSLKELSWWSDHLRSWDGQIAVRPPPTMRLTTDASLSGWGATLECLSSQQSWLASGQWPAGESRHINHLELNAVLLSLQSFHLHVKGASIDHRSDNVVTIANLNKFGGPNLELSKLVHEIHSSLITIGAHIHSRFIPGHANHQADTLSRLPDRYEWKLNPMTFRTLNKLWGPHTVDRFASLLNRQLPRYNSRYLDPQSAGMDALSLPWNAENNWVNPPFRLIPQILTKLRANPSATTLIAPYWPTAPWFPQLLSLIEDLPVLIPVTPQSCLKTSTITPEPLANRHWMLFAFRLSGAPTPRDFQKKVSLYLRLVSRRQALSATTRF